MRKILCLSHIKLMNNIKISVIVPVYNTEKYLKRCLDSILSQSFQDVEIILVNDCSSDNSLSIIKDYMRKDKRIVLINKEKNEGISIARNLGIKKAKGEYILQIDSDDWIEKDYFSEIYQYAKKKKADIVITDFYKDFDNGKILYIKDQEEDIEKKDILLNIFWMKGFPNIWNKLVKREIYIKNKILFPEKIIMGEDLNVIIKLIYFSKNIVKYNKAFVHYIQSPESAVRIKNKKLNRLKDIYFVLKDLEKFFSVQKIDLSLAELKINHLSMWLLRSNYNLKDSDYLNILNEYIKTFKNTNLDNIIIKKFKIIGKILKIINKPFIFIIIWHFNIIFEYIKNKNFKFINKIYLSKKL